MSRIILVHLRNLSMLTRYFNFAKEHIDREPLTAYSVEEFCEPAKNSSHRVRTYGAK